MAIFLAATIPVTAHDTGTAHPHRTEVETRQPPGHGPTVRGLESAWCSHDGALHVTSRLGGTGHVDEANVVIDGELSPGNSPGCVTFGGNVALSSTSSLRAEIAGTTPCSGYDRVTIGNELVINDAMLIVELIDGYIPSEGDSFDILDWDTVQGSFDSVNTDSAGLPGDLEWDFSQLHTSGVLRVVVPTIRDGDLAPWNVPDGSINVADVAIAMQLALGNRSAGALQFSHGDMDLDGVISTADLLIILQRVLPAGTN